MVQIPVSYLVLKATLCPLLLLSTSQSIESSCRRVSKRLTMRLSIPHFLAILMNFISARIFVPEVIKFSFLNHYIWQWHRSHLLASFSWFRIESFSTVFDKKDKKIWLVPPYVDTLTCTIQKDACPKISFRQQQRFGSVMAYPYRDLQVWE